MGFKKTLKVSEQDLNEYVVDINKKGYVCNEILVNMFDWDIPIPKKFFEEILISSGVCAFWMIDGKLVATGVSFVGDINEYGIGKDAFCVTKNGVSKTFSDWAESDEVVICFNNYSWHRDFESEITQEFLDESNVSIRCDIKGTRFSKIFKAKNEVEKLNIEKAIDANANGIPQVIVGADIGALISDEIDDTTQSLEVSELKSSDRLQYVSKQKDDIWKWFLNLYGLSALSNVKMAQQTSDEINNQLFSSFVLPISKLECRSAACEEISKKFNIDCSVKFSKCWELSYERILHANDIEDDNDILANDNDDKEDDDDVSISN